MRPGLTRKIFALVVLGVWAAVVAIHVRREYFKPLALRLEEGARSIAPGSHVYVVRMGDKAIGMATTRLDTVATGFMLEDMLSLDVPALGQLHRTIATTHVELGPSLDLKAFRFSLLSEVGRFEVSGHATADSLLELELQAGGEPERGRVRLEPGLTVDALVAPRLAAAGRLVVGEEATARVFDPTVMEVRETALRVTAHDTLQVPDSVHWDEAAERWVAARYDTVPAWRIEQRLGGLVVTSWVDEDGRLIRAESPLGFTLERTEFELARQEWRASRGDQALAAGYGAIIESTAIASNAPLDSVEVRDRLRVRLLDVELDGLDLPDAATTARVLAAAVRKVGHVDLVLAGRQAGDWDQGQVGAMVAEALGLPLVANAYQTRGEGSSLQFLQQAEGGYQVVSAVLPAAATITNHESNVARLPKVRDIMLANRKPITQWSLGDLGLAADEVAPRVVVEALAVPVPEGHCTFIEGETAQEKAQNLARALRELKVI